ncbi:hypothetical protein LTR70_002540 [Exophiala xenobiotica]|uniref:NAD(P)-binding protein n=1 Tax=Lithohypha guttulata TaxID=1690604 RepID=A0ABR0KLM1_9EURO|nr:hypothetical protein LTR24_001757 [Lithohypha guttulata]KAK5325374.1 hypothetical protein LTR70_002540 [Exophiala xenobiotica]
MTSHFSNEQLNIKNLFDVSKLKCVVTGGATGIGLMCTQALAANGATVYIIGRREEKLENAVSEYSTGPGKIIAMPGDITKKDECLRLAKEIGEKESSGIHLLVNNAGIARDDPTKLSQNPPDDWEDVDALSKHMLQSQPESWAETFETNVTSQFFMAASFAPLLAKANKSGYEPFKGIKYTSSIIYITSVSGLMKGSSSGQFAYAASKASAKQQPFHVATHLKGTGIRVNQIAPGVFPSEMTTSESDDKNKSELSSKLGNPSGRGGSDAEMAATLLYLAGPGGLFCNGEVIHPDGGNLLVSPAVM